MVGGAIPGFPFSLSPMLRVLRAPLSPPDTVPAPHPSSVSSPCCAGRPSGLGPGHSCRAPACLVPAPGSPGSCVRSGPPCSAAEAGLRGELLLIKCFSQAAQACCSWSVGLLTGFPHCQLVLRGQGPRQLSGRGAHQADGAWRPSPAPPDSPGLCEEPAAA